MPTVRQEAAEYLHNKISRKCGNECSKWTDEDEDTHQELRLDLGEMDSPVQEMKPRVSYPGCMYSQKWTLEWLKMSE